MKYHSFEFSLFGVNTYIVWDESTNRCVIVDPSMTTTEEGDVVDDFIAVNNLHPVHLINTHLHLDHTFGDEHVMDRYGLVLEANTEDAFLGATRQSQADMFHLPLDLPPVAIGKELCQGDDVIVGESCLKVIEVPGHSPGSIALYDAVGGFVITGDALFAGSIGRTDLPRGDHGQLVRSITDRLLSLPQDTVVLPGHGRPTTIQEEKRYNPYL